MRRLSYQRQAPESSTMYSPIQFIMSLRSTPLLQCFMVLCIFSLVAGGSAHDRLPTHHAKNARAGDPGLAAILLSLAPNCFYRSCVAPTALNFTFHLPTLPASLRSPAAWANLWSHLRCLESRYTKLIHTRKRFAISPAKKWLRLSLTRLFRRFDHFKKCCGLLNTRSLRSTRALITARAYERR